MGSIILELPFFIDRMSLFPRTVELTKNIDYNAPLFRRNQRFRRMSPEERVNFALELSDSIASITMESIRSENPHISATKLFQLTRKRLRANRTTTQQHVQDIRAILANTKVDKRRILDQARREGTIQIFTGITSPK